MFHCNLKVQPFQILVNIITKSIPCKNRYRHTHTGEKMTAQSTKLTKMTMANYQSHFPRFLMPFTLLTWYSTIQVSDRVIKLQEKYSRKDMLASCVGPPVNPKWRWMYYGILCYLQPTQEMYFAVMYVFFFWKCSWRQVVTQSSKLLICVDVWTSSAFDWLEATSLGKSDWRHQNTRHVPKTYPL